MTDQDWSLAGSYFQSTLPYWLFIQANRILHNFLLSVHLLLHFTASYPLPLSPLGDHSPIDHRLRSLANANLQNHYQYTFGVAMLDELFALFSIGWHQILWTQFCVACLAGMFACHEGVSDISYLTGA